MRKFQQLARQLRGLEQKKETLMHERWRVEASACTAIKKKLGKHWCVQRKGAAEFTATLTTARVVKCVWRFETTVLSIDLWDEGPVVESIETRVNQRVKLEDYIKKNNKEG